jgi:hypothetical protein
MMGMTYEQFKYQNLAWTYQSFSRNYHILIASSKIGRDDIIDINEIIEDYENSKKNGKGIMDIMIFHYCCDKIGYTLY